MCDNIYPSTIRFVPECFMTQAISDKTASRCFLYSTLFLIDT